MEEDLIGYFKRHMNLPGKNIRSYSPLALAYIGDAVYDLLIRTEVVSKGNQQVNKYHKQVSSVVKAEAQAQLIHALLEDLSEEELEVYRRGRNANSYTKAKNATMGNYHRATGFEALIGYLYLTEQYGRITDLIQLGRKKLEIAEAEGSDMN
jgi:ribonuclease-3 family protein